MNTSSSRTLPLALAVVLVPGLYLLITSAFFPLSFLPVFDAKRVLQLIMFVVLLLIALMYAPLRQATITQLACTPRSIGYALTLFFGLGILSSLRLSHPGYALLDVSNLFVILLLVFVVAAGRNLSKSLFDQWAVSILAIMGFAVAVQEVTGFVAGWMTGIEFSYEHVLIHFASPRFYNQLQTWSIPLLAALPWLFPRRPWIKPVSISLLGLQWFLVLSTGARGTTLSLVTAMVVIGLWLPGSRRFWMRLQLSGVITGCILYALVMILNGALIEKPGDFYVSSVGRPMLHTSGRSMLWGLSVEDAVRNPLLGAGPGRYACQRHPMLPAHPHSFPFRILGEWGFVALFLLLYLGFRLGVRFLVRIKRYYRDVAGDGGTDDPSDNPLRALLAISVLAGVMHACLSGLLIMPASQVALLLIAGWTASMNTQPRPGYGHYPLARLVLLGGLVLATTQAVYAIQEIPRLPERTGYTEGTGPLFPRFWWVGKVCDYHYPDDKS